jgi:diaminopimelate epimerase
VTFPFVKGHGTRNDFVVLPDLDGSTHGDLAADVVVALCDRRGGIGADGVLRVLRSNGDADWFMDYRNADGSISEMCGNGVRVFARYLARERLVEPTGTFALDTRDGVKQVTFCDDGDISVDMGKAGIGEAVKVAVDGRVLDAIAVDIGNPHAVAFVESLDEAGELRVAPDFSANDFPHGVNVEFAVARRPGELAMRVYERGVGETESCGTGACAVAFAAAVRDSAAQPATYRVDVPGGVVVVTYDAAGHVHLKGPAVLVADGVWTA